LRGLNRQAAKFSRMEIRSPVMTGDKEDLLYWKLYAKYAKGADLSCMAGGMYAPTIGLLSQLMRSLRPGSLRGISIKVFAGS
jgi:hypothetical protein